MYNTLVKEQSVSNIHIVKKCKHVKIDEIEISSLVQYHNYDLKKYAHISYNENKTKHKLIVTTDKMKIPNYETIIPHGTTDPIMVIPLDMKQKSCKVLNKFIQKIDVLFNSEKIKKNLFAKKASRYEYQPILKYYGIDDKDKINYATFNLLAETSNRQIVFKTKFRQSNGKSKKDIEMKSLSDITDRIKQGAKINFIFYCSKVWANTQIDKETNMYNYGVEITIVIMEYKPSKKDTVVDEDKNNTNIHNNDDSETCYDNLLHNAC